MNWEARTHVEDSERRIHIGVEEEMAQLQLAKAHLASTQYEAQEIHGRELAVAEQLRNVELQAHAHQSNNQQEDQVLWATKR